MQREPINEYGHGNVCPECGSTKITTVTQNALIKMRDLNSGAVINPYTGKKYMSNRDKAKAYDTASTDGVGCWYHECRKCSWKSPLFTE